MRRNPSVITNTLTNFLRYAIEIVVMFFITSKIVYAAGVDEFGLWSLIFSVVGFFSLLDFGLMTGTVKYVAECRGSRDFYRRNRIISSLFFVYIFLAATAIVGLLILSLFFNNIFSIPESQRIKVIWLFWIIAFRSVVLNLPLGLFMGLLFAEQRISQINIVKSSSSALYGIIGWLVLTSGYGIVGLAWVNLGAMLVEHCLYVTLSYRNLDKIRISWNLVDRSILSEITSFSVYQLIVNVSILVLTRSDALVIKLFMPLSAVATYSVALKISENVRLLVKQMINVLTPLIGELHGAGDIEQIRRVFLYGTKYSFSMVVFISVPVIIFGKPLILIWVGAELLSAYPLLCILSGVTVLAIPQLVASNILVMTNHYRYTAWASILSIVINLTVTLILIRIIGLTGVALGTLTATICIDVLMVVKKACRELNVPYTSYLRNAIWPTMIPALFHAISLWGILWIYVPTDLIMLLLINIPGALIFALTYYGMSLKTDERKRIVDYITNFSNRVSGLIKRTKKVT